MGTRFVRRASLQPMGDSAVKISARCCYERMTKGMQAFSLPFANGYHDGLSTDRPVLFDARGVGYNSKSRSNTDFRT